MSHSDEVARDDPLATDVRALIDTHLAFNNSVTPPEEVYAIDALDLAHLDIEFFSFRRDGALGEERGRCDQRRWRSSTSAHIADISTTSALSSRDPKSIVRRNNHVSAIERSAAASAGWSPPSRTSKRKLKKSIRWS